MIEAYKHEIIEAENKRNDLLKWKLILVAALSSVSLGIGYPFPRGNATTDYRHYAIFFIPLVCVYVDLLCKHIQIRIIVISKFFQDYELDMENRLESSITIFKEYERFCEKNRSVFSFEHWAQTISTYFLCIVMISVPFIVTDVGKLYPIIAGFVGILLSVLIDYSYKRKKKRFYFVNNNSVLANCQKSPEA